MAVLIIITPGGLAVYRDTKLQWRLFDKNDLAVAEYIKNNTTTNAVILTSPLHNHPVTALSGRQVVMGHPGWLWTYGYDTSATQADLTVMASGSDEGFAKMREYNIDYIVISSQDSDDYSFNKAEITKRASLINQVGTYSIYKLP